LEKAHFDIWSQTNTGKTKLEQRNGAAQPGNASAFPNQYATDSPNARDHKGEKVRMPSPIQIIRDINLVSDSHPIGILLCLWDSWIICVLSVD
jgi:hypothetical protein